MFKLINNPVFFLGIVLLNYFCMSMGSICCCCCCFVFVVVFLFFLTRNQTQRSRSKKTCAEITREYLEVTMNTERRRTELLTVTILMERVEEKMTPAAGV